MKSLDKLLWEGETVIPNRKLRRTRAYIYAGCYVVYLGLNAYLIKHNNDTSEAWTIYHKASLIMCGVFIALWAMEAYLRRNEIITSRGRNLTNGIWQNEDKWYELKDIEARAKSRKENVKNMFKKKISKP